MRRLRVAHIACLAPVALYSCFDFSAPVRHGAGGKCGDVNNWCDDGLACNSDHKCELACLSASGGCVGLACDSRTPCPGDLECANQLCKTPGTPGTSCLKADDCQSGFCTDGVCCGEACTDACRACSSAQTGLDDGACGFTLASQNIGGECPPGFACDGTGKCATAVGYACSNDVECSTGACRDGFCCDTACGDVCYACAATYTGMNNGACAPVLVDQERNDECPGGDACNGAGACYNGSLGMICSANMECDSGICSQGMCCDAACDGDCEVCNPAGHCEHVVNDKAPNRCDDTHGSCGAPPCYCDPSSVCTQALGQPCGTTANCFSGVCSRNICCNEACDSNCVSCFNEDTNQRTGICAPMKDGSFDTTHLGCDNTACDGTGRCYDRQIGQPCEVAAPNQCVTVNCNGNVCCASDCKDCRSCSSVYTGQPDGVCANVLAGLKPFQSFGYPPSCEYPLVCSGDGSTCVSP